MNNLTDQLKSQQISYHKYTGMALNPLFCIFLAMSLLACNPSPTPEPETKPDPEQEEVETDQPTQPAAPDITLDYPQGGVQLGQGWNSFAVGPANATCIVFQEAQSQEGQFKDMTLKAVTSEFDLERSFGMHASVQYKTAVYSVGAKAAFASKIDMKSTNSNISVYAVVHNGHSYVAPPLASEADRVAKMIKQGKRPDEVNAALGIKAQDVGARWAFSLPKTADNTLKSRQNVPYVASLNKAAAANSAYRAIALHPDYVEMAKNNPARFRKACGDRFVQSISKGGEITALFSFATSSVAKQQEISGSLQGSGWGASAEVSAQSKVASYAKDSDLTIYAATTGGSGQEFPTDLDSFYKNIRNFPDAVAKAPWAYNVSLRDYRSLDNWPGGSPEQPDYDAMQELAFHHSKWESLQSTLNTMLDATDSGLGLRQGYLLGRGVKRADLIEMEQQARSNRQKLETIIGDCLKASDVNVPCKPSSQIATHRIEAHGPLSSDYSLLTRLPLPVYSGPLLQSERLLSARDLQNQIFQFWIKRTWDERCVLFPSNEAICLPRAKMEALKNDIPIPATNKLVLVSLIDGRDHCASVNTATNKVNWSACKPAADYQQWLYDSNKKTFTNVANKRCLNVQASLSGNKARIISFDCVKNARFNNDKWTLAKSSHGAWMLKPGHAPTYCLSTRPGTLSSGMQLGLKACGDDKKSIWSYVNWTLISAN